LKVDLGRPHHARLALGAGIPGGSDLNFGAFGGSHSRVAITMEIYTEVPSAATREALGKLGQWLEGHRDVSVVAALAAALR